MEDIYFISSIVLGVVAIYIAIGYIAKKVEIDGKAIEQGVDKTIDVVENVVEVFDGIFDFNDKTEKTIQEVLDVVDEVSHYVAKILDNKNHKVSISLAAIDKILTLNNIKASESEQTLINVVVEESIKYVDKINR